MVISTLFGVCVKQDNYVIYLHDILVIYIYAYIQAYIFIYISRPIYRGHSNGELPIYSCIHICIYSSWFVTQSQV